MSGFRMKSWLNCVACSMRRRSNELLESPLSDGAVSLPQPAPGRPECASLVQPDPAYGVGGGKGAAKSRSYAAAVSLSNDTALYGGLLSADHRSRGACSLTFSSY